ncbi:hypothetical protein EB796_006299 [Bugula neritina]|uniref:Uncharacterized protein n=1 Tax=Bugula neritina TaxID=10212 RepID=A0A7J7KAU8_BUGNE|nr:hypothetical protein EB796_006299 [Bugula neritina]
MERLFVEVLPELLEFIVVDALLESALSGGAIRGLVVVSSSTFLSRHVTKFGMNKHFLPKAVVEEFHLFHNHSYTRDNWIICIQ